jgi:hypothetical protein
VRLLFNQNRETVSLLDFSRYHSTDSEGLGCTSTGENNS